MLGKAAALLRPAQPHLTLPPTQCAGPSFLLPQPAGRPIGAIDTANEHLLLVPTQLPLGVQVASVPAGLVSRQSDSRVSVIVMPTGHLMLADVMGLPAILADAAAAAAAAVAAAAHPKLQKAEPFDKLEPTEEMEEDVEDISGEKVADDLSMSPSEDMNSIQNHLDQQQQSVVDGVDLNEIGQFAREFKLRRLRLGLTQTQIGAALSAARGPAYSQSAISRFEKLDVTPRSAARIKQALQTWLTEAEESAVAAEEEAAAAASAAAAALIAAAAPAEENASTTNSTESIPAPAFATDTSAVPSGGVVSNDSEGCSGGKRPRKRRTSFTPEALEALNCFFDLNQHPNGAEVSQLARALRYSREVIRVWFCNRRQALRANTVKRLRPPTAPGSCTRASSTGAAIAAAAAAAASASSPSPSDSPINLSQPSSSAQQAISAVTLPPRSPNSESSRAPTPPKLLA